MKAAKRMSPSGQAMMLANYIMRKYIQVVPKEEVLILADTEADADLVHSFASVANMMEAEPTILIIPPSFLESEKYPTSISLKALEAADVFIPITPTTGHSVHSLENARLKWEKRYRVFHVGGWHSGAVQRAIEAIREHNYEKVHEITVKVAKILDEGQDVHLTSELGTDLTASIKEIPGRVSSPYANEPGMSGCLPSGEAWQGPVEGTAEGTIVIDGPISQVCERPSLSEPVEVTVKKGRVVDVKGGVEAVRLKRIIETVPNADNIAELAVGTNPYVSLTGDINGNDKRILGTMHIAFGQNIYEIYPYGTIDSPVHMDALIKRPTYEVDGKTILKDGKLII